MNFRRFIPFLILLLVVTAVAGADVYPNQKLRVEAYGRGQTTGHIADLVVRNKNKTPLQILPQRVFIPSSGAYQPYIADIPAATIKPDSTVTLKLLGYCTDEHLRPAPLDLEIIPIEKWIPIRSADTTKREGVFLVSKNSVVPFVKDHISYIITSLAYKPLYPAPDTFQIALWPGSEIPVGGTLSHYTRPDLYATVISKTLSLLEVTVDSILAVRDYSTPFSVDVKKERESLVQQLLWIYATALAGKKYEKDTFAAKIYDQFKTRSGLQMIPALEKEELDKGVDEFWNLFLRIAREAKLFDVRKPLTAHGTLVDLPMDTIRYPWSVISLTDILMKPAYTKIVPVKGSNPVIPILAGSTSAGTLLYIAFHKQEPDSACAINATLQSFPSSCQQDNGSILLSVDADSLYTYIWSNGSSGRDLVNVAAAEYSVTISKEGTTCTQTYQAQVANLDPAITIQVVTQDAHCGGSDGIATPSVNPPGSYAYTWSDGSTDPILDSVPSGMYTLIVQGGGTCTDTTEVFIDDIPISFSVNVTTNPEKCGSADGSAEVMVTPEGVYSFRWSNGDTTSFPQNLEAGTYSLTVSQPGTSCQVISEVVLNHIDGPEISVAVTYANCGEQNGAIDAEVNPPGDYDYKWSTGDSTNSIQNLTPGSYTLIVSLPGTTCTDTANIIVFELPPAISVSTVVQHHAFCSLSNGSATVEPSMPGEYTYQWSNGQATQQADNLAAGEYVVTVTISGTNCTVTDSVTIQSVDPHFNDVISIMPATCIAGGDVLFYITAADTSMMTMEIIHPGGFTTIQVDTGFHNLSNYIPVSPGGYLLTIYDPVIGPACFERDSITIEIVNPDISAEEDVFTTLVDQPVVGNVLLNDSGLNIIMVSVDSVLGGAVTFSVDGNFTFTPDAGFSGEGRFIYILNDACGGSDTATVLIIVQPGPPKNSSGISLEPLLSNIEIYDPEQAHAHSVLLSGISASVGYAVGRLSQQSRMMIFSADFNNGTYTAWQLEQLTEFLKWETKTCAVTLKGGIGGTAILSSKAEAFPYYSMNIDWKIRVHDKIDIHPEMQIMGWQKIQKPRFSIGISFPYIHSSALGE